MPSKNRRSHGMCWNSPPLNVSASHTYVFTSLQGDGRIRLHGARLKVRPDDESKRGRPIHENRLNRRISKRACLMHSLNFLSPSWNVKGIHMSRHTYIGSDTGG